MMDRRGRGWSPRLLVPVVVLLQVGLFWLAMQISQRRAGEQVPDRPDRAAPLAPESAGLEEGAPVLAQPAPAEPSQRWLPPLSDPARTLLTSYQSLPEANGLPAPSPALESVVSPGPELVSPELAGEVPMPVETSTVSTDPTPWAVGSLAPPEEVLGPAAAWPGSGQPYELSADADRPEPVSAPQPVTQNAVPPAPAPLPLPLAAPAAEEDVADLQPGIIAPPEAAPIGDSSEPSVAAPAERFTPPGARIGPRSVQLEQIARQADIHTRRAFELAGRSAHFAARSEFIMALRLVAQGLDTEERTNAHSEALGLGLGALREAEDFLPRGSRLEADLDMVSVIAGHRTPVLKDFPLDGLTPLTVFQRYNTFAQEQLAAAAGREVAGSVALQGLGKLHAAMAEQSTSIVRGAESKAIVYYQAAILACPQNYMASNDLGVMLARAGFYDDARIAMTHSLSIHPQASGWRNLAVVYRQLGQMDLALDAATRWQIARRAELAAGAAPPDEDVPAVQWMSPESFAQTYASRADEPRGQTAPANEPAAAAAGRPVARQASGHWWSPAASIFSK